MILARNLKALLAASLFAGLAACVSSAEAGDAASPLLVAVGDLHGDYEAYIAILVEAGVVDKRGRWSGGQTVLVQTGDIPDRGPDSRKIIEHLRKLQKQAPKKGGRVIALVGNHEAMNITGDLRYVDPGEYEAFRTRDSARLRRRVFEANKGVIEAAYRSDNPDMSPAQIEAAWNEATPLGKIEHQQAFAPEGEIGAWIAGNPGLAIVGDTLFVHGGVSERYAARTVDDMNAAIAEGLRARATAPDNIINDEWGPLWYRGLVVRDADVEFEPRLSPEDEVGLVVEAFGVSRIVVGHTPSIEGVKAHFDGRLIQIDTGISSAYGGARSFLTIRDGQVLAHDNGVVTEIGPGK